MFLEALNNLFSPDLLAAYPDEWGVTDFCDTPSCVGYATTITPRTISAAIDQGVDVIVTHHDAWDFMFEQREQVYALLREHNLTHVWAHMPLDQSDFGTSATLLSRIGCLQICKPSEGEVRIGDLGESVDFGTIRSNLNALLHEQPRSIHDSGRPIRRIGCVTGAGVYTNYVKDAVSHGIDLYLTGETNLYLLEYCVHLGLSVMIYSHNYTELPGVEMFAGRMCEALELDMKGHLGDSHF
jgi:putative NIF3 family GTP cyclohydrolase 1 type 2